jgi:hypothetical protein
MANGTCGQSGAPPCEDDPRTPKIILRSQGLLAMAFAFAMGITFMIFFGIFHISGIAAPSAALEDFVSDLQRIWLSFIYGFMGGLGIAVVYNLFVIRQLNLFGLESRAD